MASCEGRLLLCGQTMTAGRKYEEKERYISATATATEGTSKAGAEACLQPFFPPGNVMYTGSHICTQTGAS
jgi:hypothetical protein